ncbi:MAG: hypothetical protein V4864_02830 [Pseudomonadota bacterium]
MTTIHHLLAPLALLLACHGALAQAPQPAAAAAYDGRWSVTLVCDDVKERDAFVKGYDFQFPAEIAGGQLKGQYGSRGAPGSMALTGTVAPDGTLELRAEGISGKSEHTFGRMAQGSPYRYTMQGKLEGNTGSARRRELRACTASFARQPS